MRKILATILLLAIFVSNGISQQEPKPAPNPTPTPLVKSSKKQQDATKPVVKHTSAKLHPKWHRHSWHQRILKARVAKLRKENRRLRMIIARQKRLLSHRSYRHHRSKAVRARRSKANVAKTVSANTVLPTSATLSENQLEQIADSVVAKLKKEGLPVSLKKEDMKKLEELVQGKVASQTAAEPTPAPAPTPVAVNSAQSWYQYWSTLPSWLQTTIVISLAVAFGLLFIFLFNRFLWSKRVKKDSLSSNWIREKLSALRNRLRFKKQADSVVPVVELYGDIEEAKVQGSEVKVESEVQETLTPEDEELTDSSKQVFNLKPVA